MDPIYVEPLRFVGPIAIVPYGTSKDEDLAEETSRQKSPNPIKESPYVEGLNPNDTNV